MKAVIKVSILIFSMLIVVQTHAQRIKDLADIAGVRSNQRNKALKPC